MPKIYKSIMLPAEEQEIIKLEATKRGETIIEYIRYLRSLYKSKPLIF